MSSKRGSGRTTEQMKAAPQGATYVWCNGLLSYPRDLAKLLGRDDLRIEGPSWLNWRNIVARRDLKVVLDHSMARVPIRDTGLTYDAEQGCYIRLVGGM